MKSKLLVRHSFAFLLLILGVLEFIPLRIKVLTDFVHYLTPQLISFISLVLLLVIFLFRKLKLFLMYFFIVLLSMLFRFQIRMECNEYIAKFNNNPNKHNPIFLGVVKQNRNGINYYSWRCLLDSRLTLANIEAHDHQTNKDYKEVVKVINKDWVVFYLPLLE